MTLELIPGTDIDRERWKQLLKSSQNDSIYGCPDYLDIVSKEAWAVVVDTDYRVGMVVFPKRKWGLKYASPPPFHQVGGIFSAEPLEKEALDALFLFFKKTFRFFSLSIFQNPSPEAASLTVKRMDNYVLQLDQPYEIIEKNYSSSLKRKIKKPFEGSIRGTEEPSEIQAVINLVRSHFPPLINDRLPGFSMEFFIKGLMDKGVARMMIAESGDGGLMSALLYLTYKNRFYLILPVSDEKGRRSNAMHFLIDRLIRDQAGSGNVIDFEGSVLPGVARFYKSFGPELQHYWHIRRPLVSTGFEKTIRMVKRLFPA